MPLDKSHMLTDKDVKFHPLLSFPGKKNRNNKNGTLMNREEWKRNEVRKWVKVMKNDEKYDQSYHCVKSDVLKRWLCKTFPKTSINEAKSYLLDCEKDLDRKEDDSDNTGEEVADFMTEGETTNDEFHNLDEEELPTGRESPDMFESDVEYMDVEQELTRTEKEEIIQNHISNFSRNIIENEKDLPEFVINSRIYKQKGMTISWIILSSYLKRKAHKKWLIFFHSCLTL